MHYLFTVGLFIIIIVIVITSIGNLIIITNINLYYFILYFFTNFFPYFIFFLYKILKPTEILKLSCFPRFYVSIELIATTVNYVRAFIIFLSLILLLSSVFFFYSHWFYYCYALFMTHYGKMSWDLIPLI